jgi:hypothetical protein
MIQYALKCSDGHAFDSWFQSASAYDKLAAAGMVTCAVCGSTKVEKAIMTPRVRPGRKAVSSVGEPEPAAASAPDPSQRADAPAPALSAPSSEVEAALAELKKKVEENSDYVGKDFVSEARKMHLGDAPERSIHGEANLQDAKELAEEGIAVMPLPFLPNRKTN